MRQQVSCVLLLSAHASLSYSAHEECLYTRAFFHTCLVIAAYHASLSYSAHDDCLRTKSLLSLLPTICSGAKHDILLLTCRVLRGLSLSRHWSFSHCIFSC